MEEGGAPPAGIKVVDRRWFNEDGELREPVEGSKSSLGEPAERPAKTPASAAAPASETTATTAVTSPLFVELVAMLAQQAELFLTGAEGFPRQPSQAQRLIDYLGVLEVKTKGNLSAEESQVLSSIVFELRSLFIQERP